MKVKSSGQTHTLYRYAGQVEGRTQETKIGTLAKGTKPTEIPEDLAENLTRKECRELEAFLHQEQVVLARDALTRLRIDLESAIPSITEETLDPTEAQRLMAMLVRCKAAITRVQRNRQPVAPLPQVQTPVPKEP